jgi:hypothetical protein
VAIGRRVVGAAGVSADVGAGSNPSPNQALLGRTQPHRTPLYSTESQRTEPDRSARGRAVAGSVHGVLDGDLSERN